VRHLVLPGDLANTETVLAFLAREISTDTYLNLMDQYHPCYKAFEEPPLDRRSRERNTSRRCGWRRNTDCGGSTAETGISG